MAKIPTFDVDARTAEDKHTAGEIRKAFESLQQILVSLSPVDNFKGFLWEGSIAVLTEKKIPHRLKIVPTGYLVIFNKGGIILAGDTDWTSSHIYLKNASSTSIASGKVVVFV